MSAVMARSPQSPGGLQRGSAAAGGERGGVKRVTARGILEGEPQSPSSLERRGAARAPAAAFAYDFDPEAGPPRGFGNTEGAYP
jgi:hypothetical protein